jgi:hypothetical protein
MEPHHLAPLLSRAARTATTGKSNCRQPAALIVVDHAIYGDVIIRRWQAFTGGIARHEESGRSFDEIEADGKEECDAER